MNEIDSLNNKLSYIFGKKIKDQAKLLRLARKETNKWRNIKLVDFHYQYLFGFFKKHAFLILGLLFLLFSQGIIESTLVIFSRNQLAGSARLWLVDYFWYFFATLILVFLLNSFFAIKYERSLLVILANGIRRRVFKSFLSKQTIPDSKSRQADLVAKISYHLPLVSMGVSNSFLSFWRWLVYLGIIIVMSLVSGFSLLNILACFLGFSIILCVGAYLMSRFYVSQEVTFYSRIIKEVDFSASEINFVKSFGQENLVVNKFDKLVWFDSFFRVRRDILMRLGFKIAFALLIIISLFTHFFSQGFFSFIGLVNAADKFLFLFLIIYFSRALNEAIKIGLYLFPARLGLFLTILKPTPSFIKDNTYKIKEKAITFYSYKTKLFKEGVYYRNLRWTFSLGDRILFYGANLSGKTSLAKLFTGREAYNPRAVKVVVAQERLEYHAWQKLCASAYFVDPNFRTDLSLMEFILGKMKEDISMEEVEAALRVINSQPELARLISSDGNYNVASNEVLGNPVRAFALQALHCLVNNYYLIALDNAWLDLNYSSIIDTIKLLEHNLPQSILLVFAKDKNNYLNYQQQYEIKDKITTILQ